MSSVNPDMKRIPLYLVGFFCLFLFPFAAAYNPVSFCKCICFNNASTIPITNPTDKSKPCADCTRQFCVDNNLPQCHGALNDPTHGDDTVIGDILTICFKRGSRKDQLIVVLFLIVTTGLLAYALIRPYVRSWLERTSLQRSAQRVSPSQQYDSLPT